MATNGAAVWWRKGVRAALLPIALSACGLGSAAADEIDWAPEVYLGLGAVRWEYQAWDEPTQDAFAGRLLLGVQLIRALALEVHWAQGGESRERLEYPTGLDQALVLEDRHLSLDRLVSVLARLRFGVDRPVSLSLLAGYSEARFGVEWQGNKHFERDRHPSFGVGLEWVPYAWLGLGLDYISYLDKRAFELEGLSSHVRIRFR